MSEKVLLIHDRYATFTQIDRALRRVKLDVVSYGTGDMFLRDWDGSKRKFVDVTSLLIHKDLGHNADQAAGATCLEVIQSIRRSELGVGWRTILCSGEYSYAGVRDESINLYTADAGYNPADATRFRVEGESIHVPNWVLGVIALGWVSDAEASEFRGR
ncbi:MAG: hypothetical protein E6R05_00975 [Candidatus Moraniibacteriota bacterium]|nr:MAG: hypothetical protein E6R05_00975 [Candidatus Moranbacteria bacterium]